MIKITVTSTGFFADKPRVQEFSFSEATKVVEKKNNTVYLGDLDPEGIEKWYVENYLLGTVIQDRLISIHVKKNQWTLFKQNNY